MIKALRVWLAADAVNQFCEILLIATGRLAADGSPGALPRVALLQREVGGGWVIFGPYGAGRKWAIPDGRRKVLPIRPDRHPILSAHDCGRRWWQSYVTFDNQPS